MGLFEKFFGKGLESESIGDQTCALVMNFLDSSHQYKPNIFTFTELFAFVYFEVDSVLFNRQIPARQLIADSLLHSYLENVQKRYKDDKNAHYEMLLQRTEIYGEMYREHKEKAEIVQRLTFYMNQALGLDGYHQEEESPVVIGDIFGDMGRQAELTTFYVDRLAPFVKGIITK